MQTKRIGAAKFKERCLAILDDLGPDGIVVTKHGKPVARVLPIPHEPRTRIGMLRDKLQIRGDIMTTGIRWDATDQH